ncbi:hypothetical protein [Armatimonas sp.]|uniref:hypothetical protein n=1 Tax=Armatimonas sp. TaxID=1872638 RepID=UPI00375380C2
MKTTTETMDRRPQERMDRKTIMELRALKPTSVSITADGLAIAGTYDPKDLKPLPASVQGAPSETCLVATRKPA